MDLNPAGLNTRNEEKRRCVSVSDSRKTESCTPRTRCDLKSRQKAAILNLFTQDCELRKQEEKLLKENRKLSKETNLKQYSERKKYQNSQKSVLQKQRFSCILKDYEDCMNDLLEKHKKSSRSISTTVSKRGEKSKEKLEQVKTEEKMIQLKIQSFYEKDRKSDLIKQEYLKQISRSAKKLNSKSKEVLEKLMKIKDAPSLQYLNIISKNQRIDSIKNISRNDTQKNIEKKRRNSVEKKIKIDLSLNELYSVRLAKEKDRENKHAKAEANFKIIKKGIENDLRQKQEKFKIRVERSFSNIVDQKRKQFLAKQEIISKHKQLDNKLAIRKNSCEYGNQKARDKSFQEATDRVKVRGLQLVISKSKNPLNISYILSNF